MMDTFPTEKKEAAWLVSKIDGKLMCPNCGSNAIVGEVCLSCFWKPGEDLYCPQWMTQEVWLDGLMLKWEPRPKKRGKKRT